MGTQGAISDGVSAQVTTAGNISLGRRLAGAAAALWRGLRPPPALRRALRPLFQFAGRWVADHQDSVSRRALTALSAGPLVLSGFVAEVIGVGSAARMTAAGLADQGLTPILHDIAFIRDTSIYERRPFPAAPGGVWIAHCNPPELNQLLALYPRGDLEARYRIGHWAWELQRLPRAWVQAARSLHEIWAPSRFVADAIAVSLSEGAAAAPIVRVMPYPLPNLSAVAPDRGRFGRPPAAFVVLVMLDLRSTRARKNPDAAIDAYLAAFTADDPGCRLVCKVIGADAEPGQLAQITARLSGRADVQLLTEPLTDDDTHRLIASADVVLSLHRSEGYGLTLAEAMTMGRVAMATGWSGNIDFMDETCAVLVPYTLAPVRDPQHLYGGVDAVWAEADVAAAAAALRDLRADPVRRARLGLAARERLARHRRVFFEEMARMPWLDKLA